MAAISAPIQNLPGYDIVMDAWNEFAGEKLQTKDPYFEKLADGTTRRRKAPEGTSASDAIVFKKILSSAWKHDRCMCGCFWADWGVGQAPLISLIPVIGPWIMYSLHLRLNSMAEELHIPATLHVKMTANVTFDFLITLVPVLGAVFSYLNACSTRNAALVHTYLMKRALENQAVRAILIISSFFVNRWHREWVTTYLCMQSTLEVRPTRSDSKTCLSQRHDRRLSLGLHRRADDFIINPSLNRHKKDLGISRHRTMARSRIRVNPELWRLAFDKTSLAIDDYFDEEP
ncbi:hypothetical protein V1508DRAFT_408631 [Lipomyces doorenjongii]|uniref:uncharacterized protein n=1 Tax=Lipomyces doorenjongii TaxID=383834 RepID=UPI0034CD5082